MDYEIVKLKEIADFNKESIGKNSNYEFINYLDTANITNGSIDTIVRMSIEEAPSRAKRIVHNNDIVYSTVRPNLCHYGILDSPVENMIVSTGFTVISCKNDVNPYYVYNYLTQNDITSQLHSIAENSTSAYPSIKPSDLESIEIKLPKLDIQNKIAKILTDIDKKIKLNNKINNNLEEQLRLLFEDKILKQLNNENTYECSLYDQFEVIDNRGKTPPLVEYSKYPIIDVKVISGKERVINYNNCLKYVDENTYNSFFRSGHPKIYDTLISTVGSLAELKIYLENIGTIAQNVVALRPKNDFPLFMYQYILSLRQRLTTYDIGSVQPSIKVTQFMKEIIRIPKDKDLIYKFEKLAKANTLKMKNLMMENRYLGQLRDTLLPKLMNGEIDLDNIEI